jgi:hypothetical protein
MKQSRPHVIHHAFGWEGQHQSRHHVIHHAFGWEGQHHCQPEKSSVSLS